jgi:dephospho-CoA kinase
MKLLLAFVGEPLAGKETVSKEFERLARKDGFSVRWIQFRDPLEDALKTVNSYRAQGHELDDAPCLSMRIDILNDWGIAASHINVNKLFDVIEKHFGRGTEQIPTAHRENLQKLSVEMKNVFGDGTLSRAIKKRVLESSQDLVMIDGVRWIEDEQMVRGIPGAILWYVTAPLETRLERASRRPNESTRTREQLLADWSKETEIYIPQIGSRVAEADPRFMIINDHDSFAALHRCLAPLYEEHVLPRLRS